MRSRVLYLDICNLEEVPVCNIYDNQSDISGQATNVHIITERNGWKELSFEIPSTCMGADGPEPNHRLDYLVAEYRIRAKTEDDTDWFVISEPKISHNAFSKNVTVRAGHICELLKHKNLDLEFSETEGNNVGTAEEILTEILKGTDWSVGSVENFKEDDGTTKNRSITGEAGTGALSFIEQLCQVFEAKPIYHGNKTVDIVAMNPFAKFEKNQILDNIYDLGLKVFELHYDKNIHSLERTKNADAMATRLYAYGNSGDRNGACTLQRAIHNEYKFTVQQTGQEYEFQDNFGTHYYFTDGTDSSKKVSVGNILIYSDMDLSSRTYIWNESKRKAYKLYKTPSKETRIVLNSPTVESVYNDFPFILGLQYYDEVGLLSDAKRQEIAEFQRDMPALYKVEIEAREREIEAEYNLSQIGESNTGFLKLKIRSIQTETIGGTGYTRLNINTSSDNNGVIYRSDYDVSEDRYFQWHVAKEINDNGDPVSGVGSILYVVHNTNPVTLDRIYLMKVYDKNGNLVVGSDNKPGDFEYGNGNYPSAITLWGTTSFAEGDRFYLFCTNSMTGKLGGMLVEDEGLVTTLSEKLKSGNKDETFEVHDVWFVANNKTPPSAENVVGYGWYYNYFTNSSNAGNLYFCWQKKEQNIWHKAFTDYDFPTSGVTNGDYFYNKGNKTLWHRESNSWVKYDDAESLRVANRFGIVIYYCRERDKLHHGYYEYYTYNSNLSTGNYAIKNDFSFFWIFTLTNSVNEKIKLDVIKSRVLKAASGDLIAQSKVVESDSVIFPADNEFDGKQFISGKLNIQNGTDSDNPANETNYRSNYIRVWENIKYEYNLPAESKCCMYDTNLKFLGGISLRSTAGSGTFTTVANTRFVRIGTSSDPSKYSSLLLRVQNHTKKFFISNNCYDILDGINHEGDLLGLVNLTNKYADTVDELYTCHNLRMQTNEVIEQRQTAFAESMGDMLKDGRWQDDKYIGGEYKTENGVTTYIQGDEQRLYNDAMYMHKQVSIPETTYSFTYLDMFGTETEHYYETHDFKWPDIQMSDIGHLVDPEIGVNEWAYIDKIDRCYDKEWETKIEVDTKLTLAAEHSFTDVIARIAEVAKETKTKRSQYEMAISGPITADRLEGAIDLYRTYLNGGISNWYTDEKGNLVFEAVDGLSAMMLGGRGLGIATEKLADGSWAWRTCATGFGITADEIVSGYLSAERIEAGSLTVDKIAANVGQELEISSNKALALFATSDGTRPAGTLKTTDAMIEIIAGYQSGGETIPAAINVKSGGEINLQANAKLNLTGSEVNVKANSEINIESNGSIKLKSESNFDIVSGGEFHLRAGGAENRNATKGIYIGSDGVNFGGVFKTLINGDTSTVSMNANYVYIGNKPLNDKLGEVDEAFSDIETRFGAVDEALENEAQEIEKLSQSFIVETVRVYKTGTSNQTAPSLNATGTDTDGTKKYDSTWKQNVQAVNDTNKYLWSRNRYKLEKGEYQYGDPILEDVLTVQIDYTKLQYIRTATTTKPTASAAWQDTLPPSTKNGSALEVDPYVWVCTCIVYKNGTYIRTDIHQDEDLQSLSNAAITAVNIRNGVTSVGWVSSTGIEIKDNKLTVQSTGSVDVVGNAAVNIGVSGSNSAVILNKNGITIASSKSIAIVSGGKMIIGQGNSADKLFTVGSDANRAYIYCGKTTSSDTTHNGVYLGTDGIIVGKADGNYVKALADGTVDITGKITATSGSFTGEITATSGSIGGWKIGTGSLYKYFPDTATSTVYENYIGLGTGTYAIWAGWSRAAGASSATTPFFVKTDGTIKATKGNVGGWYIGTNYIGNASTRGYEDESHTGSTVGISYQTASNSNMAFWAGGNYNYKTVVQDDPRTVPQFYVTHNGALVASSATIEGKITATSGRIGTAAKGWYIGENYIGNASTLNASTIGIANAAANADIVFWAGGAYNGTPTFTIQKNGTGKIGGFTLSATSFTNGTSGTDTNIKIFSAKGTGNTPPALEAGRYLKLGFNSEVYAQNFNIYRDSKYITTLQIIGVSDDKTSMTLSDGSTINFNSPASIQAGWSGSGATATFAVGNKNTHTELASTTITLVENTSTPNVTAQLSNGTAVATINTSSTKKAGETTGYNSAKLEYSWGTGSNKNVVTINKTKETSGALVVTLVAHADIIYNSSTHKYTAKATVSEHECESKTSGTEAYVDGWTDAYKQVKWPSAGTASSFSVQAPNSSSATPKYQSQSYTVSVDNTYAYVKIGAGSTVVARTDNSGVYKAGQTTAGLLLSVEDNKVSRSLNSAAKEYTISLDTGTLNKTTGERTVTPKLGSTKFTNASQKITDYSTGYTDGEAQFSLEAVTLQGAYNDDCYTLSTSGSYTYYKGNGTRLKSTTLYGYKNPVYQVGSPVVPTFTNETLYDGDGRPQGTGTWFFRGNNTSQLYTLGSQVWPAEDVGTDCYVADSQGAYYLRGESIKFTKSRYYKQGTTYTDKYYTKKS